MKITTEHITREDVVRVEEFPEDVKYICDSFEKVDGVLSFVEVLKDEDNRYYLSIATDELIDGNYLYKKYRYQIKDNNLIEKLLTDIAYASVRD